MAEEYSRKAVFEILGQEVPDKEMQRADRKSTRLNSSHNNQSRMPSSA